MSVIQSLCRFCTGTPIARVINKFTENDFEKLERLLELHSSCLKRTTDVAKIEATEELEEMGVDPENQYYLDRCEAGLFTLQRVDIILVRLANMGNREMTNMVIRLMDLKGVEFKEVDETINEYRGALDESAKEESDELKKLLKRFKKSIEAAKETSEDEEGA